MNRNETEIPPQEKIKFELKTDDDWEKLDKHLEQFSYIEGYTFSNHDVSQWRVVESDKAKIKKYVNISRWYNHVKHVK
jgi:hypothetical protein